MKLHLSKKDLTLGGIGSLLVILAIFFTQTSFWNDWSKGAPQSSPLTRQNDKANFSSHVENSNLAGWKKYSNKNIGIEYLYPSDFQIDDKIGDGINVVFLDPVKKSQVFMVNYYENFYLDNPDANNTKEYYLNLSMEHLKNRTISYLPVYQTLTSKAANTIIIEKSFAPGKAEGSISYSIKRGNNHIDFIWLNTKPQGTDPHQDEQIRIFQEQLVSLN